MPVSRPADCLLRILTANLVVSKGAKPLVSADKYSAIAKDGTTYVAPQVLINVDHSMKVMMDETL
jgi:hypothetical protein